MQCAITIPMPLSDRSCSVFFYFDKRKYTFECFPLQFSTKLGGIDAESMPGHFPTIGLLKTHDSRVKIILNTRMAPVINEGFITLFSETNLWDNIAYSGIPLPDLLKFGQYFTDLSFKGFVETTDFTEKELRIKVADYAVEMEKFKIPETI